MVPERRFEPWPVALALALAAMIGASLAVYALARAYPDPVVVEHPIGGDARRAAQ